MRNYQLRKANNKLTLKKNKFWWIISGGMGAGGLGLYIYVYAPLFSRFWCYFTYFSELKKTHPKQK